MQGKSVATIGLFVLSTIFVIQPVRIRIPIGKDKNKYFPLNIFTAPILAITILWASQCLEATVIRAGIVGTGGIKPYNVLISFFSLACMSISLDVTGVSKAAAHWVSKASGSNGLKLYINFYLMITTLSAILGNDLVILSGTLFLLDYTGAMELDSKPWLMSEFAAANTASMILFVGNPTNGVICEGFGIQNAAFTAYMILPFVACSTTCLASMIFQYRITKTKPKVVEDLDPWKYIKDPVGAVAGSIILGGCLITALVVSFLRVDLWKIALPFAGAQFVFEILWDLYRSRSNSGSVDEIERTTHAISDTNIPLNSQLDQIRNRCANAINWTECRQPTLFAVFTRLPYGFIPFAFSQFILIEALAYQGWVNVFARWLVIASGNQMFPLIWIVGLMGIIFSNIAGTNVGATILLTKVVRAAALSPEHTKAAGVALALASNIGAVSFVHSASLTGLLWKRIIDDYDKKNIHSREDVNTRATENRKRTNRITQREFARWNLIPILVMTSVGLAIVCAEMVLHRRGT